MYLPQHVQFCLQRLENAGFSAYVVGGCVRDALLGQQPQDYDLCTAATPEDICRIFADNQLVLAGKKHGTIGVVLAGQVCEITTYRTEGGYTDSRHPDWVEFVTDIQKDLARRDFTVNAMAWSPTRGFADPFDGRRDLENRILRAVRDPQQRFSEDALRILRGVRFAARYDLTPEEHTEKAMVALSPAMGQLARERVYDELCKLLLWTDGAHLIRFAPILTQVIPELAPCLGFDQRNRHHQFDLFTHIAHVVEGVPARLPLRWAALLHDVGKPETFSVDAEGQGHFYGHAKVSGEKADAILRRLKAPTALREQVVVLIGLHMPPIEPQRKTVRRWLSRLGQETLEQLLLLQAADMGSKGNQKTEENPCFSQIRQLIETLQAENACLQLRDLALSGHDLMALGYRGPAIGAAQRRLLELVLDEQLPNDRAALLQALQDHCEQGDRI